MCPRFARAEPNVTVVRELLLCPIGYIQTPSSLSACAHFSDVGRTKRRVDPAACGCMPCIHTRSSQADADGHSAVRGAVRSVYAIKLATPALCMRGHEGD